MTIGAMTTVGVGMPYPRHLPGEGAIFEMPGTFILAMPNPTESEIEAVRGDLEMGLTVIDGIIFIAYKFGKINGEAPFQVHLYDSYGITVDTSMKFPESMGLNMVIHLVDSTTNITKVIRVVGAGNAFSRALMLAIQKQYDSDFDPDTYQDKLNHIYDYNSSYDIFRKAQHKFKIQGKS